MPKPKKEKSWSLNMTEEEMKKQGFVFANRKMIIGDESKRAVVWDFGSDTLILVGLSKVESDLFEKHWVQLPKGSKKELVLTGKEE